jgi:hypothetical protein
VIQQETVAAAGEAPAEAHKAQMEVAMVRSMQAVSEGTATDATQTEAAELYEAQREAERTDAVRTEAEVAEARRAVEQGLQPRQDDEGNRYQSTDDEEQLATAESQADSERQKLAHEADHRVMQMIMEASELDAEQRKAEEDKCGV